MGVKKANTKREVAKIRESREQNHRTTNWRRGKIHQILLKVQDRDSSKDIDLI